MCIRDRIFLHSSGQFVSSLLKCGQRDLNPYTCSVPVRGKWYVARGGVSRELSHSWNILNQRYAYDLIQVDEGGKSYMGDGSKLSDYYCYGAKIYAVANGTVTFANNKTDDYLNPLKGIHWMTNDFRGNFIIIRHGSGRYSFSGHLLKNSVEVERGQAVKEGDLIGMCGSSGHSTEPHLHFHIQDKTNFYWSISVPVSFTNVKVLDAQDAIG